MIAFESDRIEVLVGFKRAIDIGIGKGRIAMEEPKGMAASIASNDRLQNLLPIIRTMHVAIAEQVPLQVTVLIEAEQGMIARAFEVTVVSRAPPMAIGLADGTVHIEDDLLQPLAFMDSLHPPARQTHQELKILRLSQYLCFKPAHDAGGGGGTFHGSATSNMSYGGIKSEPFGVIRVVIASKPAVDRLPEQCSNTVLCVLARSNVTQLRFNARGQTDRVIKLPIGKQASIARDLGPKVRASISS